VSRQRVDNVQLIELINSFPEDYRTFDIVVILSVISTRGEATKILRCFGYVLA
jgi:hypothetical protein